METNTLFFLEIFLIHGVVLAWAAWELISLRRDKRRAEAERRERAAPVPKAAPDADGAV